MPWPTPLISLPFANALAKVLNFYWTILWRINDGINADTQEMILLLRERNGCCLDVAFSEKAADIWHPGFLCHSCIGQGKLAESFHRQPFLRVQQVSVLNIKLQQVGVCLCVRVMASAILTFFEARCWVNTYILIKVSSQNIQSCSCLHLLTCLHLKRTSCL